MPRRSRAGFGGYRRSKADFSSPCCQEHNTGRTASGGDLGLGISERGRRQAVGGIRHAGGKRIMNHEWQIRGQGGRGGHGLRRVRTPSPVPTSRDAPSLLSGQALSPGERGGKSKCRRLEGRDPALQPRGRRPALSESGERLHQPLVRSRLGRKDTPEKPDKR
jgi:hypothetical protein